MHLGVGCKERMFTTVVDASGSLRASLCNERPLYSFTPVLLRKGNVHGTQNALQTVSPC